MRLSPYPSIVSSSKGAGLSHTGQVHVGFFSFICRKKTASKHWRWAQVKTRHGTPSRIFTSWERERTKRVKSDQTSWYQNKHLQGLLSAQRIRWHHSEILTGQMRETRRPVVAISLSGSKRSLSWTTNKWKIKYYTLHFSIRHVAMCEVKHQSQSYKNNDCQWLFNDSFRCDFRVTLTAFTTAFCTLNRAEFELAEEVCCSEHPH